MAELGATQGRAGWKIEPLHKGAALSWCAVAERQVRAIVGARARVRGNRVVVPLALILLAALAGPGHALSGDDAGPASAYIQQFAIDPARPGTVYAASLSAGLYKSTDGADSWRLVSPDSAHSSYCVVSLAPEDPARVYAGGEGTGLWLSDDGAATWERAGLTGETICSMAIAPTRPQRVYAVTPGGVYRTCDIETGSWDKVFDYAAYTRQTGLRYRGEPQWPYSRFQKIAVSPHDPDVIFLGARWEGGYFRSDDGGDTWVNHWVSGLFRRVDTVLFHPYDAAILFAGTHHQGWFKSFNGGRSWVSLSRGLAPERRTPHYGAFLISGAVMSPHDPDIFYTGSDHGTWKTTDGGISWHEVGPTLTCEFTRTLAVDPRAAGTVYAGTNVGVFRSRDGGLTWQGANRGFPVRQVKQSLDVELGGERYRFALAAAGPPVFRRPLRAGGTWQPVSWMIRSPVDALRCGAVGQVLTLDTEQGELHSRDGGLRWSTTQPLYEAAPQPSGSAPFRGDRASADAWVLDVEIAGSAHLADSLVAEYYQRPPYVSLQLVSETYPTDGSVPVWEGHFERHLRGSIGIPRASVRAGGHYLLYVEVRDFHWNVQTGHAPLVALGDTVARVSVSTSHLLPGLR